MAEKESWMRYFHNVTYWWGEEAILMVISDSITDMTLLFELWLGATNMPSNCSHGEMDLLAELTEAFYLKWHIEKPTVQWTVTGPMKGNDSNIPDGRIETAKWIKKGNFRNTLYVENVLKCNALYLGRKFPTLFRHIPRGYSVQVCAGLPVAHGALPPDVPSLPLPGDQHRPRRLHLLHGVSRPREVMPLFVPTFT